MENEKHAQHYKRKGRRIAGRVVGGILIGLAVALVLGIFVRLFWNLLMPAVFGLREITYVQAIVMVILAHILFGAKGPRGFAGHWRGRGTWAWHGPCSGEDVANGHFKDWRRYDEWWNAEGREAFKKYVESHGGVERR